MDKTRIRKAMAVSFVVLFLLTVTAGAVSASSSQNTGLGIFYNPNNPHSIPPNPYMTINSLTISSQGNGYYFNSYDPKGFQPNPSQYRYSNL